MDTDGQTGVAYKHCNGKWNDQSNFGRDGEILAMLLEESVEQDGEANRVAHELSMIARHAMALFPGINRSWLSNGVLEDHVDGLVEE